MDSFDCSYRFITGLPWTAWLLWIAALGLGLTTELIFYFKQRRGRRQGHLQPGQPDRKD